MAWVNYSAPVDGRHRVCACGKAGVPIKAKIISLSDDMCYICRKKKHHKLRSIFDKNYFEGYYFEKLYVVV